MGLAYVLYTHICVYIYGPVKRPSLLPPPPSSAPLFLRAFGFEIRSRIRGAEKLQVLLVEEPWP